MQKVTSTVDILEGLEKIFSDPKRWIKYDLAKKGFEGQTSLPGCNFGQVCVLGGINYLVNGDPFEWASDETRKRIGHALNFKSYGPDVEDIHEEIVDWNNADDTSYEKFITRIRKALARAKAKRKH